MRQLSLIDFVKCPVPPVVDPLLVNIRGCNGAGKSTVPLAMFHDDPATFEVVWRYNGRNKVVATVSPKHQFIAIGRYQTKCGGLDSIKSTQETRDALEVLWDCHFHILMEGVVSSTVRGAYLTMFQEIPPHHSVQRHVIIFNIIPPLDMCLQRIYQRNGNKPINEKLLENKYKTIQRNHPHFLAAGLTSVVVDNSTVALGDTLSWFFRCLATLPTLPTEVVPPPETRPRSSSSKSMSKSQRVKSLPRFEGTAETLYLPKPVDLDGYEWERYYVAPDPTQVKVNWTNMRLYWYWIAERMNIWYKRTVLREPSPWTADPILQENKFTNVFRDLDKGTIVYIKEILSKMDELPPDSDEATIYQRIQEVILNTQIYRLFLKRDTWEQIGFLYLDTYKEQWEQATTRLRQMKTQGDTLWHAAYFINGLKAANPDETTNSDKLENAICLCEQFYECLGDTTDYVLNHDMKDCLNYLTHFPTVNTFNVYEWLCDWGMAYRHIQNYFVSWTDDSYTNAGPGNKVGVDFIFEDRGNLSHLEWNFYLRASWRHYMQRYGYYDQFISQLPRWSHQDINLRVIEHDLCEVQKYLSAYYDIAGTKAKKFKDESRDNLDYLLI